MVYDLNTGIDRERFKRRVNALYERRAVVECSEHKPKRSSPQNRYLHVILGEFAMQTGNTMDYVKVEYLTTANERFRNWAASEAGIELPEPQDQEWIAFIEREMQHQRVWL